MNAMIDPTAQFLGAHAETMSALTRLQLLAQTTASMPIAQKQRLAANLADQISHGLVEHHRVEESTLFPQMMQSCTAGDDSQLVQALVNRLSREHRALEALWTQLEPALRALEAGHDAALSVTACSHLVDRYNKHTNFEETVVLPLAARILEAKDEPGSTPDMSQRLRHAVSELEAYI